MCCRLLRRVRLGGRAQGSTERGHNCFLKDFCTANIHMALVLGLRRILFSVLGLVYMAGFIEYLIPIDFIKCRQIDVFG